MIVIPAIDLRNGRVVRLTRGDFTQETVYSDTPERVAVKWQQDGAKMIHVVDLDGAMSGRRKNLGSLKNICSVSKVPVQFGGGLRSLKAVEEVFGVGVSRAVLGTKALDLKLLKSLVSRFGDKIVVSLDVLGESLQIKGWLKQVKVVKIDSFCREIESIGIKHLVYTDVSRDGTLHGHNHEALQQLLRSTSMNIIVAGGISTINDVKRLAAIKASNFFGVIVGKALYENRFSLRDALRISQSSAAVSC